MELGLRLGILAGVGLAVWLATLALRAYFGRGRVPARFDRADVRGPNLGEPAGGSGVRSSDGAMVVEFTSPYCYECREALPYLKAASVVHGARLEVIDARDRPDLAAKYDIRHTPTILVIDRRGAVRAGWTGIPPSDELEAALASAVAS